MTAPSNLDPERLATTEQGAVERVALALYAAENDTTEYPFNDYNTDCESYRKMARAAIKAMPEPSKDC